MEKVIAKIKIYSDKTKDEQDDIYHKQINNNIPEYHINLYKIKELIDEGRSFDEIKEILEIEGYSKLFIENIFKIISESINE